MLLCVQQLQIQMQQLHNFEKIFFLSCYMAVLVNLYCKNTKISEAEFNYGSQKPKMFKNSQMEVNTLLIYPMFDKHNFLHIPQRSDCKVYRKQDTTQK